MRRLLALGVTIAALASTGIARGQSIDACMRAEPVAAIPLCEALIDGGDASAAVHAQLVLSLEKADRTGDARRALDRGLVAWSNDRDLLELRERLSASTSERERLEEAGARNASAMSQGKLRLLCLTKSGATGVDACREHLSSTDKDGDRIRERLARLESELAPSVAIADTPAATAPAPTPAPLTPEATAAPPVTRATDPATAPSPAPVAAGTGDPTRSRPSTPAEPDASVARVSAADAARRARVTDIQRALNAMGFDVGPADGIPGQRTRDALAAFADRGGIDDVMGFDGQTLARLDEARADAIARAEEQDARDAARADARRLAEDAERDDARRRAREAEQAEALAAAQDAERDAARDAAEAVVETDAAALMTRIGALERELADDTAALARIDTRLRELVERTLDAASSR